MAIFSHQNDKILVPTGGRALPSSPPGLQHPHLQIMLPMDLTEDVPKTAEMQFLATLAHFGLKAHFLYSKRPSHRGPEHLNQPKLLCVQ